MAVKTRMVAQVLNFPFLRTNLKDPTILWNSQQCRTFHQAHRIHICDSCFRVGGIWFLGINQASQWTHLKVRRRNITSASSTILFPSGQIIWSTCVLTFSHVRSEVLKLAWKKDSKDQQNVDITSFSERIWSFTLNIHPPLWAVTIPTHYAHVFVSLYGCPRWSWLVPVCKY